MTSALFSIVSFYSFAEYSYNIAISFTIVAANEFGKSVVAFFAFAQSIFSV